MAAIGSAKHTTPPLAANQPCHPRTPHGRVASPEWTGGHGAGTAAACRYVTTRRHGPRRYQRARPNVTQHADAGRPASFWVESSMLLPTPGDERVAGYRPAWWLVRPPVKGPDAGIEGIPGAKAFQDHGSGIPRPSGRHPSRSASRIDIGGLNPRSGLKSRSPKGPGDRRNNRDFLGNFPREN